MSSRSLGLEQKHPPRIPLKGSILNFAVWLVIKKSDTSGAESPPIETVSRALRRLRRKSAPTTGSTPTPVAKVMDDVLPRSTNVELFEASNWIWFEQATSQSVPIIIERDAGCESPTDNPKRRTTGKSPYLQILKSNCRCRTRPNHEP